MSAARTLLVPVLLAAPTMLGTSCIMGSCAAPRWQPNDTAPLPVRNEERSLRSSCTTFAGGRRVMRLADTNAAGATPRPSAAALTSNSRRPPGGGAAVQLRLLLLRAASSSSTANGRASCLMELSVR